MPAYSSMLLIGSSLVVALLAEFALTPRSTTWPVVFALPMLLAVLWLSPRAVMGVSLVSVLSYLAAASITSNPAANVLVVSVVSLAVIGALAYQVTNRQHQMTVAQKNRSLHEGALERQLAQVTEHIAQIANALEQTPVGAFAQDERLHYTWVINPPLSGSARSVIGKSDDDLLDPENASRLREIKRAVLRSGVRSQTQIELAANGVARVYDLYLHPLHAKDRTVIGLTGTAVDVSQWASAREQLHAIVDREAEARELAQEEQHRIQRMYRRVHRFVASVAHELSHPLTTIIGFAQRLELQTRSRLDASEHRMIRMILDASQRAGRMVRDLRAASTIESDNFEIHAASMDLADAVQRVIDELPEPDRARVVFTTAGQVVGVWDHDRIMQVASNLISNALKYSGADADVEVDTRQEGGYALLRVRDHGPGIAPGDQDRLFEAYTRLDDTATVEGSGLGLYIARRIVDMHGGRIWVDSEPGRGCTFHVSLPISQVVDDPTGTP